MAKESQDEKSQEVAPQEETITETYNRILAENNIKATPAPLRVRTLTDGSLLIEHGGVNLSWQ